MADGFVQVAPDSTGKKVDASELTVNAQTVERQRVVIGDPTSDVGLGNVQNSAIAGTEYGLVTRNIPGGTQTIQGVQDASTSGNIIASTTVVGPLAVKQRNVVTISIRGTYAGVTFIIEASDDNGTSWYPLQSIDNNTGQAASTWTPGTNASASYDSAIGGFTHVRVRATAWGSGTAVVTLTAQSFAYDPVVAALSQGLAATGTTLRGYPVLMGGSDGTNVRNIRTDTSGNQGVIQAVGTAATRWYVQISDGTNSPAIKAASTAAAFTDPALTVDPRPGGALVTASAAMADGYTNPTLGKQAVVNMLYNGNTWDRHYGMGFNATTGDTGIKTASGNGVTLANVGNKGVQISILVGTVSGTTPTCIFKVQGSVNNSSSWFDIPGATTASITATGHYGITIFPGVTPVAGVTTTDTTAVASAVLPRSWRVVWTIAGTTPSFTITNINYNYLPH